LQPPHARRCGRRRCFVPRVPLTTRHKNPIGFTVLLWGMWGWPLLHGISQSARFVERIREEARTEQLLCFDRVTASDVAQRGRTLGLYGGCAAEGDKVGVGGRGLGFRAI
jgi:hypothetical protein